MTEKKFFDMIAVIPKCKWDLNTAKEQMTGVFPSRAEALKTMPKMSSLIKIGTLTEMVNWETLSNRGFWYVPTMVEMTWDEYWSL